MEISNKKTLFWSIVIFLILVLGFLSFFWMNKIKNQNTPNVTYSSDYSEAKNLLVPTDFPFPYAVSLNQEFQRELEGMLEYTRVWQSNLSKEESKKIYEDYLNQNGWEVFSMEMGREIIFISGTKSDVAVSIFIGKNPETLENEIQTHFSQK